MIETSIKSEFPSLCVNKEYGQLIVFVLAKTTKLSYDNSITFVPGTLKDIPGNPDYSNYANNTANST